MHAEAADSAGLALDLDGDGTNDCDKPKWKRTYHALLQEKEVGGQTFAVASVHFVLDNFFARRSDGRAHKATWANQLADELMVNEYPEANAYAIGGDLNQSRCMQDGIEPAVCAQGPTPMWTAFNSRGFLDEVYEVHGQSDATIKDQYRDGFEGRTGTIHYRDKRIDYIFGAKSTAHSSASHDLSCGIELKNSWERNCKKLDHPDSYSDHRLVWSYLRIVPPTAQAQT